jgi:glycosyltransferase involved in cell wall biosynthesis
MSGASSRVSVVLTVYNDLRFLDAAVGSILDQTYRDFEFIIVDDGTGQPDVFARLAARDPRIRIITNETNLSPPVAANRGIRESCGDIIVRIDADDVARPERFAAQVAAFDADPALGLLGSSFIRIDEAGVPDNIRRMPETDVDVRWTILFHNPFCHASVAFRRSCYEAAGGYDEARRLSEDHGLWFSMLPHCRAGNLQALLIDFRVNPRGLSATNATAWRTRSDALRARAWGLLGVAYDPAIASEISDFVRGKKRRNPALRPGAYRVCLQLLRRFAVAPRPLARPGDDADMRRLVRTTFETMLADPTTDAAQAVDGDDLAWCRSFIACEGVPQ